MQRNFLLPTRRALLGGALGGVLFGAGARAADPGPPRRGGMLRLASPDAPDTLDPQATVSTTGMQVSQFIYDNLTDVGADGQVVPALAIGWRAENHAQDWVFDLREGVRFHHGRAFTSADVVATIERAQDRKLGLTSYGYYGPVRAVEAQGPHRVRLSLDRPFAELPAQVASRLARIVPADRLDSLKTEPLGTGPFRFKEFQPGSSLTVERNADYWVADRPYLDAVRMVPIKEAISQQAALRSGAVDLVIRMPLESMLILRSVPGLHTYSAATGDYETLVMQANMSPFDNPKVREAFRYLLDRRSLLASALFGQGSVGNDVPLPPGSPFLPDLPVYGQDLPRARALLAESGVGPLSLEVYTSSERPPAPKIAVALAAAAAQIGVTIAIRDLPYTEYAANVARKKPLYTTGTWPGSPTLYDSLYLKYHSGASYNYSGIEQAPGLDALLDDMMSEVDVTRRRSLVAQACAKIHQSSDRIIPYFMNVVAASSDRLQGFVPPVYGPFDARGLWFTA